MVALSEMVSCC